MKLEVVFVPVTDVDRAKAFYIEKVGFNADHIHTSDAKRAHQARVKDVAGAQPQWVNATPHEKQARLPAERRCH